ncbi:MAG: tetratricopeptide repeat protein [Bacteroidetes bacterium]|nr:tetratricopeptide repeat protein [Bacteroidota bacterium]
MVIAKKIKSFIIKRTVRSEEGLLKIAVGFLGTNKYKKAIELFTQVIEINPASAIAYGHRALALFKVLDVEAALKDVGRAIVLEPHYHDSWFTKGEIHRHRKEYGEAEECYKHADRLCPRSFYYLMGLVKATSAQKKYGDSIAYCNQILEQRPDDHMALHYRGLAFARMGKFQSAINDYLKLLEIGKQTAGNYNYIGFWYSEIGDFKRADNNLSVALQMNPKHPYALENMGRVCYLRGEYKRGLELVNRSLEIDPSNSHGYKNRALIYLKIGERQLAMEDLKKARGMGYAEDYDREVEALLQIEFGL